MRVREAKKKNIRKNMHKMYTRNTILMYMFIRIYEAMLMYIFTSLNSPSI